LFAADDDGYWRCMPPLPADQLKNNLRAAALTARDALNHEHRATVAQAIANRGLPAEFEPGVVIAGYSPIRSELDPVPLMRKLATQGARLALPVIPARDAALLFRAWIPGDKLQRGRLGIPEPSPEAAELTPDILLVPLAAFDRSGHRIGYGAGHYDRTLAQLRDRKKIIAIGLGFAAQEIPGVSASEHDARLDLVLTENETIDFRSL
jgi:5-formyltetrahydrofolate cyclo-ligase